MLGRLSLQSMVSRLAHKVDFINTILLGYPFPEIFITRGNIDVTTMQTTSALVDGQQRMSTIKEFLDDKVAVDDKTILGPLTYREGSVPEI